MLFLNTVPLAAAGAESLLGITLNWLLTHHAHHIRRSEEEAVKAIIAQGDQQQLEQALHTLLMVVKQREEEQKRYLRGRILEVIEDSPELFRKQGIGRELAHSFLSTAARQDADEQDLALAYQRAELATELWMKLSHLVDQALVDGELLSSQMRKAMRPPTASLETDRQDVRYLVGARLRLQLVTRKKDLVPGRVYYAETLGKMSLFRLEGPAVKGQLPISRDSDGRLNLYGIPHYFNRAKRDPSQRLWAVIGYDDHEAFDKKVKEQRQLSEQQGRGWAVALEQGQLSEVKALVLTFAGD